MSMPTLKRQWTVADRDALPDDGNRYEVIDGELFVTPSPALRHQSAVLVLSVLLDPYVRAQRVGYVFGAPIDVIFSPRRGVQPDISVVPPLNGKMPKSFAEAKRLLLAVEVLSPSTARSDRVVKRTLYRDERVPEYWIVDLDSRTIERSTPDEPRPEILDQRLIWSPEGATEPLEIDLPAFFARALDE
jgi:Uma2 family endonuclease